MRYYGIKNLRLDGRRLVGPCPVHNGDSPRAFHADLDRNVWHCFTKCHGGGNQLDLVVKKDGISIRDAALKLLAFFDQAGTAPTTARPAGPPAATPVAPVQSAPAPAPATPRPTPPATTPPPPAAGVATPTPDETRGQNMPLDFELQLRPDHPHLVKDRGLSEATLKHFGLGYCGKGILRGMIAIPIHDDSGALLAYAGRRLKPSEIDTHGKYRFPKGFKKERVLYNLNRARASALEQGLIIVEGFFSVVKLHDLGFPNVVASMGSELSEDQAALTKPSKEVFVLYDGDEAGRTGADKARALLSPHVCVRIIRLPAGFEPEDLSAKALRWLVNGMRTLHLTSVTFELAQPAASATTT